MKFKYFSFQINLYFLEEKKVFVCIIEKIVNLNFELVIWTML
jgi:hypothetical protein